MSTEQKLCVLRYEHKASKEYHGELRPRGDGVKHGRHHERLLHLRLHLVLYGEGGFGNRGSTVAQDHLFVEQKYGVCILGHKRNRLLYKLH